MDHKTCSHRKENWWCKSQTIFKPLFLIPEWMKVVLAFECVDETLWCDHSNETSSAVLSHGTIHLVNSSYFWVCGRNTMVWPFKWNLFSSTFRWYNLFRNIWQNEIWKFRWILTLATYGSERAKINQVCWLSTFSSVKYEGFVSYEIKTTSLLPPLRYPNASEQNLEPFRDFPKQYEHFPNSNKRDLLPLCNDNKLDCFNSTCLQNDIQSKAENSSQ